MWVRNARAGANWHNAVLLRFMTTVSYTRTRSSLAFLDSFLYILNFGYFRFCFFILDLDTFCIVYISILYVVFWGASHVWCLVRFWILPSPPTLIFFSVYVYAFGENCNKKNIKCSKDSHFEAYHSDIGSKQTNHKYGCFGKVHQ